MADTKSERVIWGVVAGPVVRAVEARKSGDLKRSSR